MKFKKLGIFVVVCLLVVIPFTANAKDKDIPADAAAVIDAYESNVIVEKSGNGDVHIMDYSTWTSLYRGSALLWSRTTVEWGYTGSSITWVDARQECGFIFPNIIRAKGTSTVTYSSSHKKIASKYTIGAGSVTPWGDVTLYEMDMTDYAHIYGSGYSYWE